MSNLIIHPAAVDAVVDDLRRRLRNVRRRRARCRTLAPRVALRRLADIMAELDAIGAVMEAL